MRVLSAIFKSSLMLGALTLILLASAQVWPKYTYQDIGPWDDQTWPCDINNFGHAIGKTSMFINEGRAFYWQDGGYWYFDLPGPVSHAVALNNNGAVAGMWSDLPVLGQLTNSGAFLYQNGVYSVLAPLPGCDYVRVQGMNDSNVVVGYSEAAVPPNPAIPTIWRNGVPEVAAGLSSFTTFSGIDSFGKAVGYTQLEGESANRAFTYQNGAVQFLSAPQGGGQTFATSIGDNGDICGTAMGPQGMQACIWHQGQPEYLGQLGPENVTSRAFDINNFSQIVGDSPREQYPGDYGSAILWEKGRMVDLNTLILNAGAWHVHAAMSINDFGEILAMASDHATYNYRAVLLTPVPTLSTFNVSPNHVIGGVPSAGLVSLAGRAPRGGAKVGLWCSDTSAVTIPTDVTIPPTGQDLNFPIITHPVSVDKLVTLKATYGGVTVTRNLTVQTNTPHLDSLTVIPNTTYSGHNVIGTVTLNTPAAPGGLVVTLKSSNLLAATVPASTTIPAGTISKSFPVTVKLVTSTQQTSISAKVGSVTLLQPLAVAPIALESLQLSVNTVTGGATANGVVSIPVTAPAGGIKVTLSSSNTLVATVPTTVTIPAGAKSVSFVVTTKPVSGTSFASIKAAYGASVLTRQLQVLPPEVKTFTVSPPSIKGGSQATCTVTLTGKAPTGGMVVNFSAYPGLASPVTVPVKVAAGATSLSFKINTTLVGATTSVQLSARTLSVTKTATLTLTH